MSESCCAAPKPKPEASFKEKVRLYRPLIVIAGISLFVAAVMSLNYAAHFMMAAMGLFLIQLSALQLFDLKGFAETFRKYDPLAKVVSSYAFAFPFIGLLAGAFYLAGFAPVLTNIAVFAVFAINAIGVLKVIIRKEDVRCGCAGTTFTLPVGWVTLLENGSMLLMSAAALVDFL